jgi:two-component system, sensor histidine kinase and response regulator
VEKYLNSRILVVDDEPSNIFLLEDLLTQEGYRVETASDGQSCFESLSNTPAEIILLDIMMPGMSGLEVLKKIVKDPELKNIPVIMVTAKTGSSDLQDAMDKGAFEYIKKPIDDIELLARVRAALRYKKQEDRLRELLLSKQDFINIISEDLRTPFSSISGFAEMIYYDKGLEKILKNEHKDFLKYIIDTARQTAEYFNRLLNWTNLGVAEMELQWNDAQLSKIVNAAALIFEEQLTNKKIEFTNMVPDDFTVYMDPIYFSQVLRNLISNAIKFTPKGGKVSIKAIKDGNKEKIIVSDTGVGLRTRTPEEIFSHSINKSTRGTIGEKGAGLGLGICKKIIDAHGFTITFESEVNEGTDFIITT